MTIISDEVRQAAEVVQEALTKAHQRIEELERDKADAENEAASLQSEVNAIQDELDAYREGTHKQSVRPTDLIEAAKDHHHRQRHHMPFRFCSDLMCETITGWAQDQPITMEV